MGELIMNEITEIKFKWFKNLLNTCMNSLRTHSRKWRSTMSLNRCEFDSRWFKWIHNAWKDANQIDLRPQDGRNEAFRTWDLPLDGFRVEAYQIHYHKNSWVDLSLKLQDTLRGHREDTAGGSGVRTPCEQPVGTPWTTQLAVPPFDHLNEPIFDLY